MWLLLLVTVLAYIPALWQPFFLDDYVYLDKAAHFDLHKAAAILTSPTMDQSASSTWWVPLGKLPFYRPMGLLGFAADWLVWGLHPFGYHLTNVLLHVLCVALTWHLARRLFASTRYALAAAATFAVLPVHNEAVTWVSGRFDLLVCACVLGSVLSYLNWSDGRTWPWLALSVLCFTVGLGSKETALILPVMILAIEALRGTSKDLRTNPARSKAASLPPHSIRLASAMVLFAVVALAYVAWRIALFGSPFGRLPAPYGLDMTRPLAAAASVVWYLCLYLMNLVLCINVEAVYLSQFWGHHLLLLGICLPATVFLFIAAIRVGWSRVAAIGLVWLGLFTAPSLLSMPGERNVYLASVGLALLVAAVYRALTEDWHAQHTLRKLKQAALALAGVWVVLLVAEQLLIGCVASASEKVYQDLQAALPNPPPNAQIYVVNQNPLNSVGFAQAIRLRYNRPDLSGLALSLAPALTFSSQDKIVPVGRDSIQLVRNGGTFFESFAEQFHRFSDPVSTLAQAAARRHMELINPPVTYDNLKTLEFRFPYPLDDPRLQILCWDNHQVHGFLDMLQTSRLTQLKQCNPTIVGGTARYGGPWHPSKPVAGEVTP